MFLSLSQTLTKNLYPPNNVFKSLSELDCFGSSTKILNEPWPSTVPPCFTLKYFNNSWSIGLSYKPETTKISGLGCWAKIKSLEVETISILKRSPFFKLLIVVISPLLIVVVLPSTEEWVATNFIWPLKSCSKILLIESNVEKIWFSLLFSFLVILNNFLIFDWPLIGSLEGSNEFW